MIRRGTGHGATVVGDTTDAPLVCVTRRVQAPEQLLSMLPERDGMAWVTGADGMVGAGVARRWDIPPGRDRFAVGSDHLDRFVAAVEVDDPLGLPGTGPVAVGSFTFADDAVGSVMLVPRTIVGRRGGVAWVTHVGAPDEVERRLAEAPLPTRDDVRHDPEADHPRHAGSSVPDVRWLEAVADAVARIRGGELEKVVLARDVGVWAEAPFDLGVLASRLHARFPGCATFVVDRFVGATPELLVELDGRHLTSTALAGTAPRAQDPDEDEALGETLLSSAKDRHEHAVLVEEVAALLAAHGVDASHGEVPHLLRLDNVQHLATRFVGLLAADDDSTALDLAAMLHPTPAVGGTPTRAAIELIDEIEGLDRGRYAGPVGWVDADGDGQWGIALRCAEVHGARARLFAGAGVVGESLPEAELEETRVKLRAMRDSFSG